MRRCSECWWVFRRHFSPRAFFRDFLAFDAGSFDGSLRVLGTPSYAEPSLPLLLAGHGARASCPASWPFSSRWGAAAGLTRVDPPPWTARFGTPMELRLQSPLAAWLPEVAPSMRPIGEQGVFPSRLRRGGGTPASPWVSRRLNAAVSVRQGTAQAAASAEIPTSAHSMPRHRRMP